MTYGHMARQARASDPVNSLMSWPVTTVEITDSLAEVSRELGVDDIGAVLVLQDGFLAGVVSERDVAAQVGIENDLTQVTAGDVMSADLVTVPPQAPISRPPASCARRRSVTSQSSPTAWSRASCPSAMSSRYCSDSRNTPRLWLRHLPYTWR
jgi:hypothetical protein